MFVCSSPPFLSARILTFLPHFARSAAASPSTSFLANLSEFNLSEFTNLA